MKGIIIALASWVFTVVVLSLIFGDLSDTTVNAMLNTSCFVGIYLELGTMKRKFDKK